MEYQFQKKTVPCLAYAARENQNQELTQEIKLNDGMPDIGRVVCAWGQLIIRSKEWISGSASVTGGVMVNVLYAPEDGSEPRCVDTWIPFQMRWSVSDADRDGTLRVIPLLRFVDGRTVSARKMMVRAGVAIKAEALYPTEFISYEQDELPDNIQVLRNNYPVRLIKESGEKTFVIDEELSLSDGEEKPEKIIYFAVRPELTDKKVMTDKVLLRGNMVLHALYKCESGLLGSREWELGFSQFSELGKQYGTNAVPDIQMAVTSLEFDRTGDGLARLKCGIAAQYYISDEELLSLPEDAYSCTGDLEIHQETIRVPVILDEKTEIVSSEHTIAGVDGKLLDVVLLPDFPQAKKTEQGLSVDNSGVYQVLYYDENNALQSTSSRWEEQTEIPAAQESDVDITVAQSGKTVGGQNAEGFQVNSQILMQSTASMVWEKKIISGLGFHEADAEESRPSVILCKMNDESLWSIAKRCRSTVNAIQRANNLQSEQDSDKFIVVPIE